jgi:hypothetical protein
MFSLWPCVVTLLVIIPVSFWHERNWRKTLADYSALRREAGAPEGEWPPRGLSNNMGVQPGLILTVCALLAAMTAFSVYAALIWPNRPPGFDMPINPYDLPYLWAMAVAGTATVIAGVAVAMDLARSPWTKVARNVRRAIYAPQAERERRFALALAADPGVLAARQARERVLAHDAVPPLAAGEPQPLTDDIADAQVLHEVPVADLEDPVGPLGD